jgi:hypothetical protein
MISTALYQIGLLWTRLHILLYSFNHETLRDGFAQNATNYQETEQNYLQNLNYLNYPPLHALNNLVFWAD